jgi:hypothetical protein
MASFSSQEKAWLWIVHLQGYDQIAGKRRSESFSGDVVVLDYFSILGDTLIITVYFTVYFYRVFPLSFSKVASSNQDSVSSVLHCYACSVTTDEQQNGGDYFLLCATLSRGLFSHIIMCLDWLFVTILS